MNRDPATTDRASAAMNRVPLGEESRFFVDGLHPHRDRGP
jgi:hypothetical protein